MSEWEVPRREPRYALEIQVTLRNARQQVQMRTEDVSFSGMFLRTDEELPEGGLIKLEIPIPGDIEPLGITAVVVHLVPPGGKRTAGAGLQFYGVGPRLRDRWARYVLKLREADGHTDARPLRAVATSGNDKRRHLRYSTVLAVRTKSLDELVTAYTRDISRGGTFLYTSAQARPGERVYIELVHPESGAVFGLECVVRRSVRDGLGVEFVALDAERQKAFWEFVEPVVELDMDDLIALD